MTRVHTDPRVRAAYAEGGGIYRIIPSAVAIPEAVTDVQELVRQAERDGPPLVPRGAGSGMPGGNVGSGCVIDLSQSFRGLAIDPQSRNATPGASITWAQLTAAPPPPSLPPP